MKESSACEGLHNRDADTVTLADLIQFFALGSNTAEVLSICLDEEIVQVFTGREHVKGRIQAKQDRFDPAAQRREFADNRIMPALRQALPQRGYACSCRCAG